MVVIAGSLVVSGLLRKLPLQDGYRFQRRPVAAHLLIILQECMRSLQPPLAELANSAAQELITFGAAPILSAIAQAGNGGLLARYRSRASSAADRGFGRTQTAS